MKIEEPLAKSPNRQVGVLSFQPTRSRQPVAVNPPTGRLGIFHSSLQETTALPVSKFPRTAVRVLSGQPTIAQTYDSRGRQAEMKDPQPAGWGIPELPRCRAL